MGDGTTDIAGIEIPSANPVFLTMVGLHVLLGLACVVTGAIAMLSPKRSRPPSPQRDDLFLVPGRCVPDGGRFGGGALGSGLSLVCPGRIVVCGGLFRAARPGGTAGAIGPGCTSPEWDRPMFCC